MTLEKHENYYDPTQCDGSNHTLTSPISPKGLAEYNKTYTIQARCGRAVRLAKGDRLTIINPSGKQVCDFWAFTYPNLNEYMSMEHCHTSSDSIIPKIGDTLVTNARQPILSLDYDDSPGVHDTVIAACDAQRYQQLGCDGYHDNCTDNLRMALLAIELKAPAIPSPFNLWMNIPIAKDGSIWWLPPVSSPGNKVVFIAAQDCVAVMSACPQDMTPVNGDNQSPSELEFLVTQ